MSYQLSVISYQLSVISYQYQGRDASDTDNWQLFPARPSPHCAPLPNNTAGIVRSRMVKSSHSDQLSM